MVLGHDRELEVRCRAAADDREGHLGSDPVHRQQEREEPQILDGAEPIQRLLVFTDEVKRMEFESASRLRGGQDGRCCEDPITDPAHLDDERIRGDRPDNTLERGDHVVPPARLGVTRGAGTPLGRRPTTARSLATLTRRCAWPRARWQGLRGPRARTGFRRG